eukprot:jgi/Bigna1/45378/e_gw1.120.12.1
MVWLRRDVRLCDHEPLHSALEGIKQGKFKYVMLIYVYEPDITRSHDFSSSQLKFINDGLMEFNDKVRALGGCLVTQHGELPQIFETLNPTPFHGKYNLKCIMAHWETGNRVALERTKRVESWAAKHRVTIKWFNHTGVFRELKTRDGWAAKWKRLMERPCLPPPSRRASSAGAPAFLWEEDLGIDRDRKPEAMGGGESRAQELLRTFTEGKRSVGYGKNVSSPNTAWEGCSRLSPYLTWGHISLKTVYKAIKLLRMRLSAGPKVKGSTWPRDLVAFEARLRWRSHFMQKLEDEPEIEYENMCRAYDVLRKESYSISGADVEVRHKFDAWCSGRTGYPMVDAVMRCLHNGGWVNFRMRAMLVSFASYNLWLDWRPTSRFLSKHFLDYEPGIHYPQFQMQSGTTGINSLRIYNPVKQAKDHDKDGVFVRRYVTELADVPKKYIFEPWKMPASVQEEVACIIGKDYPKPIVDHSEAYKFARKSIGNYIFILLVECPMSTVLLIQAPPLFR